MPRLRLLRSIPHNRQELSTVSVENQAVITRAPHPKTGNGLPRAATLTRRPRKDGKEDRAPSTEKKCARRKRQSGSEITRARRLSRSTTAKHACTENELEEEGFITSRQGKGFFVMSSGSNLIREQLIQEVEKNLNSAILAAERASMTDEELIKLLRLLLEVNHE